MSPGDILKRLRLEKELSQAAVAEATGLSQPGYSLVERGQRVLKPRTRRTLERLLALGEQRDDEEDPVYILAKVNDEEPIRVLFTDDGSIGFYQNRGVAEGAAAGLFRAVGKQPVHVLPAWLQYVALAAVRRHGPDAELAASKMFFVDSGPRLAEELVLAVAEHAIGVARAMQMEEKDEMVASRASEIFRPPPPRKPGKKRGRSPS